MDHLRSLATLRAFVVVTGLVAIGGSQSLSVGVAAAESLASPVVAPPGWHASIDAGVAAAKKSGRALLVATAWTDEQ
jgi:hypothetical protein